MIFIPILTIIGTLFGRGYIEAKLGVKRADRTFHFSSERNAASREQVWRNKTWLRGFV